MLKGNHLMRKLVLVVFLISWSILTSVAQEDLFPDDARLELVIEGLGFAEGPLYTADGQWIVSDITGDTVYTFGRNDFPEVFLFPSNYANGHALDDEGRILQAQHNGEIVRIEDNGRITILADNFEGASFNSPNDLIMDSEGFIWFTDPRYGLTPPFGPVGRTAELTIAGVYRLDPDTGDVELMIADLRAPNGIGLSPDEDVLYVTESNQEVLLAYPINRDGSLGDPSIIGDGLDGLEVDTEGRIWVATTEGVAIYAEDGERLGFIDMNENVTNLAFGGDDRDLLYITTSTDVYRVQTLATGIKNRVSQ
jgi:gluconolactonase